jgi:hypothetical protein
MPSRRARRGPWIVGGLVVAVLALLAAGAIIVSSSNATLRAGDNALASIGLPLGGGKIESVTVTTGPNSREVPVRVQGQQLWPKGLIPAHTLLSIDVVLKRPGWISWLSGSTQTMHLQLYTPSTQLRSHYLTLRPGAPIQLKFKEPVRVISYGLPGHLHRQVLQAPRSEINLHRISVAGTLWVAAAPRSWETSNTAVVSWFPSGSAASATSIPVPGSVLKPSTPITLTFNKPVSKALGSNHPVISPATPGTWTTLSSHTIQFQPSGYGYGLGAPVTIGLPSGVQLVGAQPGGAKWTVPPGSTLRLQQLLAQLGYLPLVFKGQHVPSTPIAQENAAVHPPTGRFDWKYANTPSQLRSFWKAGASGVMTQGALMAFEDDHALITDGVAGPAVWKALIDAAIAGHRSTFGYTFVMVHKDSSPQSLSLWHNGHIAVTAPVNTGIPAAPTASGTYPVFEHLPVTTMTGTNPDGSHYSDPGIQYVSYFNGGDALHAFTRAQYGFPQSLGCVEMPLGSAAQVYPYTPIGTLVNVA